MSIGFRALLHRLFREDSGQDLVEYALLTSVVGIACAVAAPYVGNAVSIVYGTWVNQTSPITAAVNPISAIHTPRARIVGISQD